ncbi:T9SS type A sorting domain-containing protein [bacterium]|nr:T9SS type A sorting domain-containing protein [bacterium]
MWTDWILVEENAVSDIFYELPEINQQRYAKWKLVLNTANSLITPEIEKVVFVSGTGADRIIVFPNPYITKLNSNKIIIFANLSEEATIRIYTISGKLIKIIKHKDIADGGSEEWNVSDVASGIYIYCIDGPSGRKKGKVSIIK